MKLEVKVSDVQVEGDQVVVRIENGSIRFDRAGQLQGQDALKPGDKISVTLSGEKVSALDQGKEVSGRFHAVVERAGEPVVAAQAASVGRPRSRDF